MLFSCNIDSRTDKWQRWERNAEERREGGDCNADVCIARQAAATLLLLGLQPWLAHSWYLYFGRQEHQKVRTTSRVTTDSALSRSDKGCRFCPVMWSNTFNYDFILIFLSLHGFYEAIIDEWFNSGLWKRRLGCDKPITWIRVIKIIFISTKLKSIRCP